MSQDDGLGLADALELLRTDLAAAHKTSLKADVQFPIATLTIELKAALTKSKSGKAGFTIPVVGAELGGSAASERQSMQTITVNLGPPMDREGNPLRVASKAEEQKG
jgi:hypothetical protein